MNVYLFQEFSDVIGGVKDEFQLQLDGVWQHVELLRSRASSWSRAHAQCWTGRRVNGGESTARLDNESFVFVVWAVIEHFVFQLCSCRFNHYPSMSFSHWGRRWFVVTVSMRLFFLHFASFILCREVCVRCEVCFVVLCVRLFWEQIDVLFCSMKFRCVIAGAFGVGVFWMHSVATSVA